MRVGGRERRERARESYRRAAFFFCCLRVALNCSAPPVLAARPICEWSRVLCRPCGRAAHGEMRKTQNTKIKLKKKVFLDVHVIWHRSLIVGPFLQRWSRAPSFSSIIHCPIAGCHSCSLLSVSQLQPPLSRAHTLSLLPGKGLEQTCTSFAM